MVVPRRMSKGSAPSPTRRWVFTSVDQMAYRILLFAHTTTRRFAVWQARSGRLPDRLEEGDQFLGDGLGCEQRGKVPNALQFADVRVGDVLGNVLRRIGEEGAELGLLSPQEQDRKGNRPEHLGVSGSGPS